MENSNSFQFPASIIDPQKIYDCLTDEQKDALSGYIGAGITQYYKSMMAELDRVEAELKTAKVLLRQQNRIIAGLSLRCQVAVTLPGI